MKTTLKKILGIGTLLAVCIANAGIDRGGITVGDRKHGDWITVNGTVYDASGAAIIIGGTHSHLSALHDGQIVTVRSADETNDARAIAEEITYDSNVSGPIEEMDPWADYGLMTVLGQGVKITSETRFGPGIVPASVFGLQPGMHIQVSGHPGENDGIDAAWIGLQPAGSRLEVIAPIKNVDTEKREFTMNDLVVSYEDAEVSGFINGDPVDGDFAQVWGWGFGSDDELRATVVRNSPPLIGPPGYPVTIDAVVTFFDSEEYFELGGVAAAIDGDTSFNGGGDADDIDIGVRLRIDGHFDEQGMILADSVEFISGHGD